MPLPGELLSASALTRGVRTIRSLGRSIVAEAREAGMTGPQAMLANRLPARGIALHPLEPSVIDRAWSRLARDVAWVDDGWCPGRALEGAQLVAQQARRPLGRAVAGAGGSAPLDDAVAAAVGVLDGPFVLPGGKRWGYHAVTVVQPADARGPLVLDGLFADRPMSLDAWARGLGRRAEDVELRHPWDLRGLSVSPSLASGATRVVDNLESSLRAAGEAGAVPVSSVRSGTIRAASLVSGDAVGRAAAFERRFGLDAQRFLD